MGWLSFGRVLSIYAFMVQSHFIAQRLACAAVLGFALSITHAAAATTEPPDEKLRHLLRTAVVAADSFQDRFDAQVWMMDMSTRLAKRLPDPKERVEFLRLLHGEAAKARLEPELVMAVIDVESNFDRFAISRVGARGLMQVMPFWRNEIGRPDDNLFQVKTNLRYGCTILRYYLDAEKGNLAQALARYNGSAGRWEYPNRVFKALNKRWYRQ